MRQRIDRDSPLASLSKELKAETGANRRLDQAIAETLSDGSKQDEEVPPYTSSVDACIALVHRLVPNAHWHVGYGPMGIEPYAFLSNGKKRWETSAPTVPLALLSSLLKALLFEDVQKSARPGSKT